MNQAIKAFSSPGPEEQFFTYLRDGRFMLQRDRTDGTFFFYPRAIAPGTGSIDWEWVEASGRGQVYATSIVRQRPERGGDFNVSLVELAEGPRMMTNVIGIAPDKVAIGMDVRAAIREIDGEMAVQFEPEATGDRS